MLKKTLRILFIPLLLFFAGVLCLSLWDIRDGLLKNSTLHVFGAAFIVGVLVFCRFRLNPLYVFGHEMTHWLAAKLTGHATGEIRLKRDSGYVRVENPTVFITLAPYFFPIYFFVLAGLSGIWRNFLSYYYPSWGNYVVTILLGISLAYHVVLTFVALRHGQSDLNQGGKYFSISLIVFLNVALIYLAAVFFLGCWHAAWHTPWEYLQETFRLLYGWLRHWF